MLLLDDFFLLKVSVKLTSDEEAGEKGLMNNRPVQTVLGYKQGGEQWDLSSAGRTRL